jgi:hypothetical protein
MPRGIGTYGSQRGRPKKKKKYGAGGSTSFAKMKKASAYGMGGKVNMSLKKFRHGGMCKRK